MMMKECDKCGGDGEKDDQMCKKCMGSGEVYE